ncbi:metallophosphoesterase family protein [Clostridium cochlearium]|jgi:putative phosphoesterase|uniref:Phosphoesterase n=1 Tax=Clostridium cochlearium TaxID=1494 RepID=A0A240AVJ6_CLOCO|nr:metallophosphoesterase family protein [Clostridium cochlearium]MBE6065836.1 metallophosphoesterase family protein [Clostridium cochlearium]MBU5268658.1 metallophosphatase family protein [Clostridium cochlearium]MCG4571659.1 metallophosphatase family protein [Clostridium cochlearium]MCR1970938.1 metallophosphatase family protein [Clostridium cochlearium]MDU1442757.1 metallophosphoesterase family protein [Clostridium cochlearium]
MKIGIISDTHITKKVENIDKILNDYFYDVDTIIHVGDFNSLEVIKRIRSKKKFIGVYGNNDSKDVKNTLPIKDIIRINGYKIGIFHGHGSGKNALDRAYDEFKDDKVDIIIFGHSHQPIIKTRNKILMINPGSPMRKLKERWYSYVLLELHKRRIEAKMVLFKKK